VEAVPKTKMHGLTEAAFRSLLARLDNDLVRAGERYRRLHHKLAKFFTYEGAGAPEDCADEVINRVARRLEEGEPILDPERYALGVARLLFKEVMQRQRTTRAALVEVLRQSSPVAVSHAAEARIAALEACLDRLPPGARDLVIRYYQGERSAKIEERKALAAEHNIPPNALRNRVFRLREKLEQCLEASTPRQDAAK